MVAEQRRSSQVSSVSTDEALLQLLRTADKTPGVELAAGVLVGLLCSALALSMGYCPRRLATGGKGEEPGSGSGRREELPSTPPEQSPNILSRGRLELPLVQFKGTYFQQFSWVLDRGGGGQQASPAGIGGSTMPRLEARGDRDSIIVRDSRFREVARAYGRLMAAPNGEMRLESHGHTWAVLKRPAPSRRPGHLGQLWDFKICRPDGQTYAEVRQRSDTKCIAVEPQPSQRRMMAVIGNFTYPVFLTGERNIHVWTVQGGDDARPGLVAQCEAAISEPGVEAIEPGLMGSSDDLPLAPEGRDATAASPNGGRAGDSALSNNGAAVFDVESLGGGASLGVGLPPIRASTAQRRFHVSTTAGADASLVLAVLLGLQDVHRTARRDVDNAASVAAAAAAPPPPAAAPSTGETSPAMETLLPDGQPEQEKPPTPREQQPATAA